MILQALKHYYDRKRQDPDSELEPAGWINKGIDYVIVLEKDGRFVNIECLQSGEGKSRHPKIELVPHIGKQALKHTNSGKDANLLWDNAAFVFGLGNNGNTKVVSFCETIREWFTDDDEGIKAVCTFINNGIVKAASFQPILQHPSYGKELLSGLPIVAFRLIQDTAQYVFYRPKIKAAYEAKLTNSSKPTVKGSRICLITGEPTEFIELTHSSIKNLHGQEKIGPLVSFNERSFESFGKEKRQGENAPISKEAAAAYSKALAHLLKSKQRLQVGDASTIFWAEVQAELENTFSDIFTEPPKDDPDRNVRAVKSLYRSIETGSFVTNNDATRFYVLGLAPNAARISIRFWHVGTVAEISVRILQHLGNTEIERPSYEKAKYVSLNGLLSSTANETKYDPKKANLVYYRGKHFDVKPNLAGDTMRAILSGSPYPATLLQAAVRRIRAEQEINYPRAALIKAYINRSSEKEELKVSLDENNTNPAYRLGRLFAVLEHIQERANPNINATIRDRYYGAASATPVTVFSTLLKLKNHHITKLNKGEAVNQEKLIGAIMNDGFDGVLGFPPTLSLPDQGRFAIGYYHQRQSFFTKSSDSTNKGA
ncbi:MAG: type I-C CRISPR-associated protein Cas8c/Csd1 [Proteobacteria bacterium]|nr:type I-C CRISPR-associated protein Cas8c/Csd1 [Pseudomonadota bacterium]